MPPAPMRLRVTGDPHEGRFRIGGAVLHQHIACLLGELGTQWSDYPEILEWGLRHGPVDPLPDRLDGVQRHRL